MCACVVGGGGGGEWMCACVCVCMHLCVVEGVHGVCVCMCGEERGKREKGRKPQEVGMLHDY